MTSSRRLRVSALATTSALLMGLAAAVAPHAAADANLVVSGTTEWTDSSGTVHLFGEVKNVGAAASPAQVDVLLFDAGGTQVDSAVAQVFLEVLAPGDSAPFEAQLDPTSGYTTYTTTTSAPASGTPLNHAFSLSTQEFVDSASGNRTISGTATNNNTVPADNVTVVFTFYKGGAVVFAEAVGAGSGPIAAGGTGQFAEVIDSSLPAYDRWTAVAQSTSAPSGDGTGGPPASGTDGSPATTLNCNPAMTLSTKTVNVGRTTRVSVAGATPGSKLTLEGYSRPSTEYAPIRTEVAVAQDGTITPFEVRPPTSARVRLQIAGCSTPGTGQVISVIPGLGIAVTRIGTRTYRFSGKIIPGKQNTGRYISLYVGSGTATPVKKTAVRSAADGSYGVNVLLPKGAVRAYWYTGADMTNLAGKSAVKSFTSY